MSDEIRIEELRVQCVVGIFPEERMKLQPIVVDARIRLDLTAAATGCDIDRTRDYALFGRGLELILVEGKFRLLETAGLAMCAYLLAPDPHARTRVVAARVSLQKPEALKGHGVPSVTITRRAGSIAMVGDVLFSCGDATVRRNFAVAEQIDVKHHGAD